MKELITIRYKAIYSALVLTLAGIAYILLNRWNLSSSAAFYVGIPLIIALGYSFIPTSHTAFNSAMRGLSVAILLSAIVFKEGYLCIIFASPLFYFIVGIIAHLVDRANRKKEKAIHAYLIASIFALLSLEGTSDFLSLQRENSVVVSKVIDANIADIRHQLAKTPNFDDEKPFFLKIFPYPSKIEGQGLALGDIRQATFTAYKHIWWTKREGVLAFKVIETSQTHVKFAITRDDSYVSNYLQWQSSEVILENLGEKQTKVTWKHDYKRLLDPAFYFAPMQYYAVKLTTEQLIDFVAKPKGL